jgi:DNA repair ATPase RecN
MIALQNTDKVKEIARMLGGEAVSKQSIAHAEAMLSSA